jgi:hypothetical protein
MGTYALVPSGAQSKEHSEKGKQDAKLDTKNKINITMLAQAAKIIVMT